MSLVQRLWRIFKWNTVAGLLSLLPLLWNLALAQDGSTGESAPTDENAPRYFRNDEPLLTNVSDVNGRQRHLKVVVLIESDVPEKVNPNLRRIWPEVAQEFIFLVAGFRAETLNTTEGKLKLLDQLKTLINTIYQKSYKQKDAIKNVYFDDLALQ